MSTKTPITKENMDFYLKELAKEIRRRSREIQVEMILVGGASIVLNYGFRAFSYDIDATYPGVAASIMKEAILAVSDKFGLQNDWVNDEFKKTTSFTPKIVQYSNYYKTFSNVLRVRTVRAEYLVAMKLVSGRQYKKDLSDIAGILHEERVAGKPLDFETIDRAVCDLYGSWDRVLERTKEVLNEMLTCEDLEAYFVRLSEDETAANKVITEIDKKYPGVVKKDTIDDIIATAAKRRSNNVGRIPEGPEFEK